MPHGRQAPEDHGQGVSQPGAQAIDDPADHDHADRIEALEGKNQVAEVDVIPSQIVLQGALENAQDLAVHVVFCGSEQEEGTDDPAEISGPGRGLRHCRC